MEPSRRCPMYFEPFAGGATLLLSLHGGAEPFLRWVGGKRQLLGELRARLPCTSDDPIFSTLNPYTTVQCYAPSLLSDRNWRLMSTYSAVARHVDTVVEALSRPNVVDTAACYYRVRDELNGIIPVDFGPEHLLSDGIWSIAWRMIYLNKTGFNGLYRENSKGEMNTPYGHNARHGIQKVICNRLVLHMASGVLQQVKLACEDFRKVTALAQAGDFFYFDPPYWPVKATSFIGYAQGGSDIVSVNTDLATECRRLSSIGARFLASNADVPQAHELYKGFTIERVSARRNVNCKASERGPVGELLIRNY